MRARIGTAGWTIPASARGAFPEEGSTLERYAARFDCVEINSSFYRSHRPATWERWAGSVPEHFRFAVKLPKAITHEARFVDCADRLAAFAEETSPLGDKLGIVLVQIPPSFAFDPELARGFFAVLRETVSCDIAFEPRHASWFAPEAEVLLADLRIARVAADPPKPEGANRPGGWPGLVYLRLHGSPRIYFSAYDEAFLARMAQVIAACDAPIWCIFDNTGGSAAAANALELQAALG